MTKEPVAAPPFRDVSRVACAKCPNVANGWDGCEVGYCKFPAAPVQPDIAGLLRRLEAIDESWTTAYALARDAIALAEQQKARGDRMELAIRWYLEIGVRSKATKKFLVQHFDAALKAEVPR